MYENLIDKRKSHDIAQFYSLGRNNYIYTLHRHIQTLHRMSQDRIFFSVDSLADLESIFPEDGNVKTIYNCRAFE